MAKPGASKPAKATSGPSTKALPGKTVKKTALSQEHVGDSDTENAPAKITTTKQNGKPSAKGINGTAAKPKAVIRKEATSSSESSDEASEEDGSESEEEEGSDDSDDSSGSASLPDIPVPKKPNVVPAKINGVKRKASEQESPEEASSDESESEESSEPQIKKAKHAEGTSEEESDDADGQTEDDSSEETGDESEDETSQDSDERAIQATPTPTSKTSAASRPPPPSSRSQSTPVRTFSPPKGYIPLAQSATNTSLAASSLAGKQIWHITAPSSVPLTSLTTLAASSHQTGAEVLTHKGTSYALQPDTNPVAPTQRLLLPSAAAAGAYDVSPHVVSATLHLRPRLAMPALDDARQANGLSGGGGGGGGGPRPQPKGLRMRYRPPGFGRGDLEGMGALGGLDDEGGDASTLEMAVELAQTLAADGVGAKEDGRAKEKSKKKDKKKHGKEKAAAKAGKSEELDKDVQYGDSMEGVEEAIEKKRERAEKARRKEEKRARKEAKAKAREVVDEASR